VRLEETNLIAERVKEDVIITEVWRRFAPPNKPFLLALRGAPVQGKKDNWQWLAQQDRQRFTVPYAERLSKGSIRCKLYGLLYEAIIPLGQASANHPQPPKPGIQIPVT